MALRGTAGPPCAGRQYPGVHRAKGWGGAGSLCLPMLGRKTRAVYKQTPHSSSGDRRCETCHIGEASTQSLIGLRGLHLRPAVAQQPTGTAPDARLFKMPGSLSPCLRTALATAGPTCRLRASISAIVSLLTAGSCNSQSSLASLRDGLAVCACEIRVDWEALSQGYQAAERFNAHNQPVIDTVPAERLLVWQATDGWAPLCGEKATFPRRSYPLYSLAACV